jgi:hypothetical protein
MDVLTQQSPKANYRWAPSLYFDGAPPTLAGRRLARRYRMSSAIAELVAALAGLGAAREAR